MNGSAFRGLLVDLVLIFCISVAVTWMFGIFVTRESYPLLWSIDNRKNFLVVFLGIAGALTYLRFSSDGE